MGLVNYWKLTTERCFYVREDIHKILCDSTIYANVHGSNFKENNMNLHRALERYSQRAKNRSTSNNFGFPEVAKLGQLK
jgi:hypothetical protein